MNDRRIDWTENILSEIGRRTITWPDKRKKDSGISFFTECIYTLSRKIEDDHKWEEFKKQVEMAIAAIPENDNPRSNAFASYTRQMGSFKKYVSKEFGYSDHKSGISSWWPLALIIYVSGIGGLGVMFDNYPLFIIVGISFLLFLAPFHRSLLSRKSE